MTRESKYASCLNALDEMQQSVIYVARKGFLAEAESIIVRLESETAEQRAEIERLTARTWTDNVQFIADAKENLLQQYVNLTAMYGEQKHMIRAQAKEIERLQAQLATAKGELERLQGSLDGLSGIIGHQHCQSCQLFVSEINKIVKQKEPA